MEEAGWNEKKLFCFIHIEKSGGITLHNLLHSCFPGYISPSSSPTFGEKFTAVELDLLIRLIPWKIPGIGGHKMGAFLGYEQVLGGKVQYFSFLRAPLKRYLSHYNWQRYVEKRKLTIEKFAKDPRFHNFQTYRIAGERNLDKALTLINSSFMLVGLIERYDESLLLLGQHLNLPMQALRYERSNVKDYGIDAIRWESLSAELQELILENNRLDIDLYRIVKDEIFPTYLAQYNGDMAADLEAFRNINKDYRFPITSLLKRKSSNYFLKGIVQPLIQYKVSKSEAAINEGTPKT